MEQPLPSICSWFKIYLQLNLGRSIDRFAQKAHASEKDAIVAEMIPQNRPKEWTLAALRGLANDGRQILIIGRLVFDSHHKIGDSPRFPLWEVHPTARLLVCQRPDNNCDPSVADQWKPL